MKRLISMMAFCAVSACVSAQTDTTTHHIDEVQVVDSRKQHTMTSTAPLHVMEHGEMLRLGVTDMADALHRMPGITLRDYGGAGGMKTVSVRGFGAKHTGVSYDGVMLSECQSGEIDLSRYSLDNVGSLSLVIGDNDDIFIPARQATTPATINIQSINLPADDLQPHLTAQMKLGSFGYASPFLKYEQNVSDRFAFSALGEYTYAENDYPFELKNGNYTTTERRTNSRMNSGHGELNMVWRPTSHSRLSGKFYYYDNDRQLPGQVRYYTNVSGETLHDRNAFGQLLFQTYWTQGWSFKWHAKFNWNESVYKDKLYAGGVNDASYWQREAYTSASLLYVVDNQWSFDYSLDYAFNNLNGSSWRTVVGRPYRHTVLQSVTGKYRSQRFTVLARLLHSLYLNDTKEGASARNMRRLSPSVSLSWQLFEDEQFYLRASYKNIFRSPTFNESYYYHYGSTDLKPETTDQFNVGITYAVSLAPQSDLRLTADVYTNHIRDMIVSVPSNMFIWTCINVDKVNTLGIDVSVSGQHRFSTDQQLTLQGHYSYQRVKNKNNPESPYYNYQIAYQPEHTASGAIGWENPWLNLSLHAVGMSSRWPNNAHYEGTMIPGYVELGLTAWHTFRLGKHRIEGRFDLKNLTDKQYSIVANYPMSGRSWQITINYKL